METLNVASLPLGTGRKHACDDISAWLSLSAAYSDVLQTTRRTTHDG
jgi:hypothetical protein